QTTIYKPYKPSIMKFLLTTLLTVFSLVSTTLHASDETKVSAAIISSFNTSFKNASEVKWSETQHFFKADFSMNGQYATAYYDATASLIAVTRNITSFQLPITLQTKLKTSYENHWISDLFELSDDNGTAYYVTVENGDEKLTLKSTGTNEWSVYKRQRKC
ncbi:MAG: hypothetical protein ACXWC7_20370, partial [Chitinophagaceae bacterium]